MKKLRKVLSVALAALMLLSLFSVGFSVSADEIDDEYPEYIFNDYYGFDDGGIGDDYSYMLGDVDNDWSVTVRDATCIQKHLAGLEEIDELLYYYADVDGDANITIKDATTIQKYVAGIIDEFPVSEGTTYTILPDGRELTFVMPAFGAATIEFELESASFCNISVHNKEIVHLDLYAGDNYYYVCNETVTKYFEAGEQSIYLEMFEDYDVDVTVCIEADPYVAPEFESDPVFVENEFIDIEAGTGPWIFCVGPYDTDTEIYVNTEGEDPKLDIMVLDSSLNYVDIDMLSYGNLDTGFTLPAEESYYLYITQESGGSDFTLYCGDLASYFDETAINLNLNEIIMLEGDSYEYDIDGDTGYYTDFYGILKFIPDEDNYYRFDYESGFSGYLIYTISDDPNFENSICEGYFFDEPLVGFDVEYLDAGKTYYIIVLGTVYVEAGVVTVTASLSDETEYEEAHRVEDDYEEEFTIPTDCESIAVGEGKAVEIDEVNQSCYWYKLTVEEDGTLVIYSDGSSDARLDVYTEDGTYVGGSDDSGSYSLDFTAIGNVSAGDVYYLNISSWDFSDAFDVFVVNELDYISPYGVG